jgi:hypothetical protein
MGGRMREGAVERIELGKVGQMGKVVPQQGGLECGLEGLREYRFRYPVIVSHPAWRNAAFGCSCRKCRSIETSCRA